MRENGKRDHGRKILSLLTDKGCDRHLGGRSRVPRRVTGSGLENAPMSKVAPFQIESHAVTGMSLAARATMMLTIITTRMRGGTG